jgi:hypothetical protein
MNTRLQSLLLASATLLALMAPSAHAGMVYGLMRVPQGPGGTSQIVTFDSATPQNVTILGSTGLSIFQTGLDFDAAGNLYLSTGDAARFLYGVNTTTGAATLIGGSGLADNYFLSDLSWDPVGNRMLALASRGGGGVSPILYQADLATGALTSLGTVSGITDGGETALAVNAQGTIFILGNNTDRFYAVDRNTLAATALNPLPFNSTGQQGATVDWSGTNTMYYAAQVFNVADVSRFYTVNQADGNVSLVGTLGANLEASGVQVSDIAIRPIPEPSSIALFALGGIGIAVFRLRRRSR